MSDALARRFVAAGAILFLLGLQTGFVIPAFANPRMGLSSHLEGVMNDTFLIALGAAWGRVTLSNRLQQVAFWLILYGSLDNWLFVSIAAIFGTRAMTPIAGAGQQAAELPERIVGLGLISVGLTMVVGVAIVVYGLLPKAET
ncbi:MAG: hydrogenase [Pseudomonadales bacterium]|jgi:hydroxylaminobenzene mutase|nr:hydrogenase [Pseudomonadales bacterium]